MSGRQRVLVIGSSGGGGDWPPLAAAASALLDHGHDVAYFGDDALAEAVRGTNLSIEAIPPGRDLNSYWRTWLKELRTNPQVPMPLSRWTKDVLPLASSLARKQNAEVLLCTDFTFPLASALRAETGTPLCLIHSSFLLGESSKRRIEDDFAPGVQAFGKTVGAFLGSADLVLLATDSIFDPPPDPCPANHHWVGPLIWEPVQD